MTRVTFIDTSALCNIVPVHGRCQHETAAKAELKRRLDEGELFVLPATAIIETGNFIAHIHDGRLRRATAQTFSEIVRLVAQGEAPWILHEFAWGRDFLLELVDGSGTGVSLIDHAVAEVGTGDLTILEEMRAYRARSQLAAVSLWTYDHGLAAYA